MCKDNDNSAILDTVNDLTIDVKITFHENYGADIAPFLSQLKSVTEPFFIKIHGKKSYLGNRNKKHIGWRSALVHSLIGSQHIVYSNLDKLINDANIGIISNKEFVFTNLEKHNSKYIDHLCSILNINYDNVKNSEFIAGSMFMSRTDLFKKFFSDENINTILKLLSNELGKVDDSYHGTYSHAMERIFTYLVKSNNLLISHTKMEYKFIANDNFYNGMGKLIILYNNDCYIENNINIFGQVLINTTNNIDILWKHQDNPIEQQYVYLNRDTLINSKNYIDYINKYAKLDKPLSIEIISFIKNEEMLIEQFLQHHLKIADKITIVNNGSTDNTINILKKYIDYKQINIINYPGFFKDKANICTEIMKDSQCDVLIPLDADELIVFDNGISVLCDAPQIKEYLQNINTIEQKYRIRNVYNKHPGDNNDFEVYKSDLQKIIFLKPGFIKTDTGFHHGETKNNKPPEETHILDISYLHYKFICKKRWIESTKAKVYARLGDKHSDLTELKKYIANGFPESNQAVKAWIRFLEEDIWCDLSKDISIKTPIDLRCL